MTDSRTLTFDSNTLIQDVVGPDSDNLRRVEEWLGVRIASRGNALSVEGPAAAVESAETALESLYERARRGTPPEPADVDAALRLAESGQQAESVGDDLRIVTKRRRITPRSPGQAALMRAMQSHELVFATGPAGTGKTYLAVAQAVAMMLEGRVDRIILSRPAVEAGERLGFLPGDLREKVDPYLRPLYDALYDSLPSEQVHRRMAHGDIEVAPLAFMRGRTLSSAFVILDEAQNTTPMQMKMFLTRLGENARMVVTGDLTQVDLPKGAVSGLTDAMSILRDVDGVDFVHLGRQDVVRHDLVTRIVNAYEARDKADEDKESPA